VSRTVPSRRGELDLDRVHAGNGLVHRVVEHSREVKQPPRGAANTCGRGDRAQPPRLDPSGKLLRSRIGLSKSRAWRI